jgi:hypothetical protein
LLLILADYADCRSKAREIGGSGDGGEIGEIEERQREMDRERQKEYERTGKETLRVWVGNG